MEGARQGKQKGDVQKVQLAVVELVETTVFSAMVEGLNGRYSHYLLDSPFFCKKAFYRKDITVLLNCNDTDKK